MCVMYCMCTHQPHHVLNLVHDVAVPVRRIYVKNVSDQLPVWWRGVTRNHKNYPKRHIHRFLVGALSSTIHERWVRGRVRH